VCFTANCHAPAGVTDRRVAANTDTSGHVGRCHVTSVTRYGRDTLLRSSRVTSLQKVLYDCALRDARGDFISALFQTPAYPAITRRHQSARRRPGTQTPRPSHRQADRTRHSRTVGVGTGQGCLLRTRGRVVRPAVACGKTAIKHADRVTANCPATVSDLLQTKRQKGSPYSITESVGFPS